MDGGARPAHGDGDGDLVGDHDGDLDGVCRGERTETATGKSIFPNSAGITFDKRQSAAGEDGGDGGGGGIPFSTLAFAYYDAEDAESNSGGARARKRGGSWGEK